MVPPRQSACWPAGRPMRSRTTFASRPPWPKRRQDGTTCISWSSVPARLAGILAGVWLGPGGTSPFSRVPVVPLSFKPPAFKLADQLWHSDSSFNAIPASYSLLSGRSQQDEAGAGAAETQGSGSAERLGWAQSRRGRPLSEGADDLRSKREGRAREPFRARGQVAKPTRARCGLPSSTARAGHCTMQRPRMAGDLR
jgi:hypothetical protein